jgi:hypothetical protein
VKLSSEPTDQRRVHAFLLIANATLAAGDAFEYATADRGRFRRYAWHDLELAGLGVLACVIGLFLGWVVGVAV